MTDEHVEQKNKPGVLDTDFVKGNVKFLATIFGHVLSQSIEEFPGELQHYKDSAVAISAIPGKEPKKRMFTDLDSEFAEIRRRQAVIARQFVESHPDEEGKIVEYAINMVNGGAAKYIEDRLEEGATLESAFIEIRFVLPAIITTVKYFDQMTGNNPQAFANLHEGSLQAIPTIIKFPGLDKSILK